MNFYPRLFPTNTVIPFVMIMRQTATEYLSSIPEEKILVPVVPDQLDFTSWMREKYTVAELKIMCQKGCHDFPGLRNYNETTTLYAAHKEEIWKILTSKVEKMGHQTLVEWFSTFTDVTLSEPDTFESHLVWCAAREVAKQLRYCR